MSCLIFSISFNNFSNSLLEYEILKKGLEALHKGDPLRRVKYSEDELDFIKGYNFITLKPIIYVANVSEEDVALENNKYIEAIRNYAEQDNALVVIMCAKMESELAELNDVDKAQFLEDIGIKYSGLDKLIFATYSLLGLETFFTAGSKEVRAWTFIKGMTAKKCAGIIHSDFERGFIKAEVMSFNDLEQLKDEKKVKEAGKLRLEGKDYIMQDGDVVFFRFNV